jgi:hypothetical protein
MNATISYTDFDGVKRTIEVEVSVDLQEGPINSGLEWNEKKLVLRHDGKIVGRKSLCYRETERN